MSTVMGSQARPAAAEGSGGAIVNTQSATATVSDSTFTANQARGGDGGVLATVAAAMSALVAFAHGYLVWLTIAIAAVATGLAAYVAALPSKKILIGSKWLASTLSRTKKTSSNGNIFLSNIR